jgi:hypothetical protein
MRAFWRAPCASTANAKSPRRPITPFAWRTGVATRPKRRVIAKAPTEPDLSPIGGWAGLLERSFAGADATESRPGLAPLPGSFV